MNAKTKYALLLVLFFSSLLIAGCETIKGAFRGASEGAKKDWESAEEIDDWMRENLW